MKRYKLPFNITLERKYNDINIEEFLIDWNDEKENRKNRPVMIIMIFIWKLENLKHSISAKAKLLIWG